MWSYKRAKLFICEVIWRDYMWSYKRLYVKLRRDYMWSYKKRLYVML